MSPRRRSTSSKTSIALVSLIILIIFGIYNFISGKGPADTFPKATTPPDSPATIVTTSDDAPTAANASGEWWEVYFTDPQNINNPQDWQGSIEGRLIEKIDSARTSIHIASFEFDLTPVAEALISAKQRGVDVRWVTDDENGLVADDEPGRGQFAMLQEAGIEVRSDDRSALMHNKFWIFDRQTVWTGSTNITESGIFKQDNNTLVIQSPALAAVYENEFQEMWNGQFGPKSPSQKDQQTLVVNGSPVQVVFTSEDKAIEESIIPVVNSASQSIRFLAFSFTDFPLASAMIQRAQNGVDVAGVFEKVGSDTDAAELKTLYCAQIPVRRDGNSAFMHNKVIVVDQRYVITGSLNFSTNAEDNNDENVIIIDNPDIARLYIQDFDRLWSQASDPEPEKFPCS